MSSLSSKRKLDDAHADELMYATPAAARMRKEQTALTSSNFDFLSVEDHSPRTRPWPTESTRSVTRRQFFVRMLSEKNLVLQADCTQTIRTIHEKIQSITGIPVIEQRLIYRGKQLQWEQTLAECNVQNDACLQLVGRMRSTGHPQAWQLINDVVSNILYACKNTSSPICTADNPMSPHQKTVKTMLTEFLSVTPRLEEQACGHFQIFLSSSAAAALVMLYMSSHRPNRDSAEESIKQFLVSSKTVLPRPIHILCAPIVLEFCNLLRRAAGTEDPMYTLCRSSLGNMVENIDLRVRKGPISLQDIFPFVTELATKLSQDLVLSMESSSFIGPSSSDVRDFTAFLSPVRRAFVGYTDFHGPFVLPLSHQGCGVPLCYGAEMTILHGVFNNLLAKLEECLAKIEERTGIRVKWESETLSIGCCQYLAILKELNEIARLYGGAEEAFWAKMEQRKDALGCLILRFAKRKDEHWWILEHKEVTNFEVRRHLAMMMLPEVKDEYDEILEMLIDRSQLLAESFGYISQADPASLRNGLFMEFKNEEATGPGVLREWFFLVCQAIFNPQNALFVACPKDRRRFFPNPASKVDPMHLQYFSFSGRVMALALMHKVQVGIVFDRVFFLQLAGRGVSLEDIQDADPYLYNSCKQILEMDPDMVDQDALGLTFAHEVEELGSRKIIELCPNGKNTVVTSKNRKQYVDSLIQYLFVTSIAEQVAYFSQGFADVISSKKLQTTFFQSLDPDDLDCILYGSENAISVEDWKAHTEYNGYKESDRQITWFWEIVGQMSAEQRKVLLFFWTSIKHLPVEGFSGLASQLYIYKTRETSGRLPSSHTCFYRLCFPAYSSKAEMQDRLNVITQEHVGCSFGTW